MDSKPFPAYEGDAPYFFVCYAHDDAPTIHPEMEWLNEANFNLWYDDGIHVGTTWRKAIANALSNSSALIFFATEASIESEYCIQEINYALDDRKPVFVVQMDNIRLPRQLRLALGDRQALVRSAYDVENYRSRLTHALSTILVRGPADGYTAAAELLSERRPGSLKLLKEGQLLDLSRIAVFPFANLGGDPSTEYFSDGLTDELINALAQINDIHVVSRTSVFEFKGKPIDVRTFGERLRATVVLEGSVRSVENHIRVTVQLTNVADGFNLWSGRFDRQLSDIFTIQDEITHAIVKALRVRLRPLPEQRAPPRSKKFIEAYDLYLQGTYNWNKQTEEGLQKALQCFEESITLDQDLGVAHAGLAEAYGSLGFHGFVPTRKAFPKAMSAAKEALRIDHTLPDANISMALALIFLDRDWNRAETYLHRAMELNPSSAKAYWFYAIFLLQRGHFEQGRAANRMAIDLDPLNVLNYTAAGWAEYYAKRPQIAIEKLEDALAVDPNYPEIQVALGAAYEQLGKYDQAIEHVERVVTTYGPDPLVLSFLGAVHGAAGNKDKTDAILAQMDEIAQDRYVPATCRALIYMGLRDTDNAIEYLEQGVRDGDAFLSWLNVLPLADWLRDEPRFTGLLAKIGFPTERR